MLKEMSWGIAIRMGGEPLPAIALPAGALKITENLWLQINVDWELTAEEGGCLKRGSQLVARNIESRYPSRVLVRLSDLEFNPCDYQPEGLTAAVAEWAAEEFDFPKPNIPVTFDRTRNK